MSIIRLIRKSEIEKRGLEYCRRVVEEILNHGDEIGLREETIRELRKVKINFTQDGSDKDESDKQKKLTMFKTYVALLIGNYDILALIGMDEISRISPEEKEKIIRNIEDELRNYKRGSRYSPDKRKIIVSKSAFLTNITTSYRDLYILERGGDLRLSHVGSEMGHAVVHAITGEKYYDVDLGIDEAYDYLFEGFAHYVVEGRHIDSVTEEGGRFGTMYLEKIREEEKKSNKTGKDIVKEMLKEYKFNTLRDLEEVLDAVYYTLLNGCPQHQIGQAIITFMRKRFGNKYLEVMIGALYDPNIDKSDPNKFIGSISSYY